MKKLKRFLFLAVIVLTMINLAGTLSCSPLEAIPTPAATPIPTPGPAPMPTPIFNQPSEVQENPLKGATAPIQFNSEGFIEIKEENILGAGPEERAKSLAAELNRQGLGLFKIIAVKYDKEKNHLVYLNYFHSSVEYEEETQKLIFNPNSSLDPYYFTLWTDQTILIHSAKLIPEAARITVYDYYPNGHIISESATSISEGYKQYQTKAVFSSYDTAGILDYSWMDQAKKEFPWVSFSPEGLVFLNPDNLQGGTVQEKANSLAKELNSQGLGIFRVGARYDQMRNSIHYIVTFYSSIRYNLEDRKVFYDYEPNRLLYPSEKGLISALGGSLLVYSAKLIPSADIFVYFFLPDGGLAGIGSNLTENLADDPANWQLYITLKAMMDVILAEPFEGKED